MIWKQLWLHNKKVLLIGSLYTGLLTVMSLFLVGIQGYDHLQQYTFTLKAKSEQSELSTAQLAKKLLETEQTLASTSAKLEGVVNQDQYQINRRLEGEIAAIEKTFKEAAGLYEDLVELKTKTKTAALDSQFATIIKLLSERNYSTASAQISDLKNKITTEENKVAKSFTIPSNVPQSNTPPTSGYSRQQVITDAGTFMVSLVSADLNSTRVVVDTASENDCQDNCPVIPLADYVSRSGGFAGINGPYACPAEYPACAGKKNTFDTLIMNKKKVYFNSDNNVYSVVPAVIFSGNSARFVGKSLEWGRSTEPDSVIAAQPFLVSNGTVVFGGDGDPKKVSKSLRGFIGVTGSTVYIGIVHNATVADSAKVLKTLGIQNALNLDGGGSAALWSGGYKVGPGRSLPFGIVLIRK